MPSLLATLSGLVRPRKGSQWTDRLAGFASPDHDDESLTLNLPETASQSLAPVQITGTPISLRLEGPYFTVAEPQKYKTVICLVAGTGISGAMAIAGAFKELERQSAANTHPWPLNFESQGHVRSPNNRGGVTSAGKVKIRTWTRCIVIWSVRETQYIALPELQSKTDHPQF